MASVEDRAHYRRGWDASKRYGQNDRPNKRSALEAADMRGESAAWYLGYEDYACGREKWTSLMPRQPESADVKPTEPTTSEQDQAFDYLSLLSKADRMAYDLGADEAEHNAATHGITAKLAFAYFCDAVRELGPSTDDSPNRHALYWHGCSDRLTRLEGKRLAERDANAWKDLAGIAVSPRHASHANNVEPTTSDQDDQDTGGDDSWMDEPYTPYDPYTHPSKRANPWPHVVDTTGPTVTLTAQRTTVNDGSSYVYSLSYTTPSGDTATETTTRTAAFIRLRRMTGTRAGDVGRVDGYTNDQLGDFLMDAEHGHTLLIPRNDTPPYGPHLCPDECGTVLMAPCAPGLAGDDSWYCPGCGQAWTLDLTTRTL